MYLVFVVISELFGYYLMVFFPHNLKVNLSFYRYFEIPVEFIFFFALFYLSAREPGRKTLPALFIIIYLLSIVFDEFYFSRKTHLFDSISYTIGNLLLLILILRFFVQMVTSDDIMTFRQNMLFWVSLGLLFFYLGSFPFYALLNMMGPKHHDLMNTYKYIVYGLNSTMYLMFTFSFIWGKTNIKSY